MSQLLRNILASDALEIRFQPVVELIGDKLQLHMLECLTRGPQNTNAARADVMFEYVRRKRVEPTVDRACILLGLHAAASLPGTPDISFNAHASTLGRDPDFPRLVIEMADDVGIDPSRITIEIIEHAHGWDGVTFAGALRTLRSYGARIALDDVGLGHSNYQMMIDTHAQYMKIDRYFVHGAHADLDRRAVLDSIAQLALRLGARVVGEGVEEGRDLMVLTDAGIDLAQGYLFARPLTVPELLASGWLQPSAPKTAPNRIPLAGCPA